MKYLGLLLYFISITTFAADVRLVKARIQSTDVVTLGQVAVIKSEDPKLLAELKAFPIVFDTKGWASRAELQQQLESKFKDESLRLLGWNQVRQFQCGQVDITDLEQQVKRYLVEVSEPEAIRIDRVQVSETGRLPCLATYETGLTLVKQKIKHLFQKMRFSFVTENKKVETISFDIDLRQQQLTTNKPYHPGAAFIAQELISSWKTVSAVPVDSAHSLSLEDKLVALVPIQKGSTVNAKNVRKYGGISEGQHIKVVVFKNGIRLEANAKALTSAQAGEDIQVVVQNQTEPVTAKVKGEGIAYVAL